MSHPLEGPLFLALGLLAVLIVPSAYCKEGGLGVGPSDPVCPHCGRPPR